MAHKHVLRERVVKNTPSGPQNSLAFSGDVPGGADARRPVVVVGLIEAAVSNQDVSAGGRIEVAEVAVLFLDDAEIVVAQAEIQGEFPGHVNTVLEISGVGIFKGVAIRIPLPLR